MAKVDMYREQLRSLEFWDEYMMKESGLPGPRGNLELARAAALEGGREDFMRWLAYTPDRAPANTREEFLAFCGAYGLGKLAAGGEVQYFVELRRLANDPRWRTREAVAMALQLVGETDMAMLLAEVEGWLEGSLLEQRAVAAGLCEPALLGSPQVVERVLEDLDKITLNLSRVEKRTGNEDFRVLRQALGYCWSVAAAALPEAGKKYLEKWAGSPDPDMRWMVRENLKKQRLVRLDPDWAAALQAGLQSG